jgi:hypothetical protein
MSVNHRSHVEQFRINAEKLLFYNTNPNATYITIASQDSTALDFENIDHIEIDDIRIKKLTHQVDDSDVITFNDNGKINFHSRILQNLTLDTPTINSGTINTATFYNGVIDYPSSSAYQNKVLTTDSNGTVVLSVVAVSDLTTSDIADENLVDKTATEGITGFWTFSNAAGVKINQLLIDAIPYNLVIKNTNTSDVVASDYIAAPSGLRHEWYSGNNLANKDALMLLVENDKFSFHTNTDFDGGTEVLEFANGEMFRFSTGGGWINDSFRVGGSVGTPTATMDIHADTPVLLVHSTGSSNQHSQLTFSPHGTGGGIIQYKNDLFFNESASGQVLKFTDTGIEFANGATIINTSADLLTITEATVAISGALTTGSITMNNGTTIVNTSADLLTITEAKVLIAGNFEVNGDIITNDNIQNSTANNIITFATGSSGLTSLAGNLKISGGGSGFFIQNSGGNNVLSCETTGAASETRFYGNIRVDGNAIENSTGNDFLTVATGLSPLVTIPGGIDTGSNAVMCGSTTYSNGATIVNDSSALITITEATVACSAALTTGTTLAVGSTMTCGGDITMNSASYALKTERIEDLGGNTSIYVSNGNSYLHFYPRMTTFASYSATYRFNLWSVSNLWTYHYDEASGTYEPSLASYDFYSSNSAQYQSSHTTVQSSDRRWKNEIKEIDDYDKFYDLYNSLTPKKFKWNDKAPKNITDRITTTDDGIIFGFVAQEVEKTKFKKMVITDKLGNPQNKDLGYSKLMCCDCGKQCECGFKDRCDDDCCKCNIDTRKEKEVWCNEGCCGDDDNHGDISSNCCEKDDDDCMGEGFKTLSYGSLIPLNYIAVRDIKSKYDKLKIDHDQLKLNFEKDIAEEINRNKKMEIRIQKLETMIVSIMSKIS